MRTAASLGWGVLVLTCALGCASQEAPAQDKPASKPTQSRKTKKKDKKPKDLNVYRAKIEPQETDAPAFALDKAVLVQPEVSLFGGGSGKTSKELELVFHKAATIQIPFHRIKKIEVGKTTEDRLAVSLTLKPAKDGDPDQTIKGTVKASLVLEGKFATESAQGSDLPAKVKLRDAKTIAFEVTGQEPPDQD